MLLPWLASLEEQPPFRWTRPSRSLFCSRGNELQQGVKKNTETMMNIQFQSRNTCDT